MVKALGAARKHTFIGGNLFQALLPYFGLLILILILGTLTNFTSVSPRNLRLIFQQSYVLIICSVGVFFVMTMGSLDFSQGSIIGVASIAIAFLAQFNLILAVIVGIVIGAVVGSINGFLFARFKVSSFIVTICTMFIFRGVCAFLTTEKPMSAPIYIYSLDQLYIIVPVVAVILGSAWFLFSATPFGRKIKAIGAGETAARFSGIRVANTKFFVYMLAGALAGFAATINTIRVGSITATSGTLLETNIMIALVLGGMPVTGGSKNKFSSVIVGALLFAILNNGLALLQIAPNIQQLIRGVVFLAIVVATTDRNVAIVVK